jgi:hypothetical protein
MPIRPACVGLLVCLTITACGGCIRLASRSLAAGPGVRKGEVVFRFHAPTARRVQLAGNWPANNWARGDGQVGEASVGLMEDKDADGIWEIVIPLPPGRYKYLFWVDENSWHTDPGNPDEVEGGPVDICSQIVLYQQGNELRIR